MQCSQCQTENSERHRFCFHCGTALTVGNPEPTPASHAAGEGERKQLTVMFCDLVGSTALSMQFDPEELREIIRAFQDACVTAVERYDGFVAQHLGDGLVIYFGYPRAHEDDSARAVHAGLDTIAAVSALSRPDLQLQVRVGIATGKVVICDMVSAGAKTEMVAVGQTPNLAARLQGLAAPNTVVISPHTYRLLGQRFECKDLGKQTLKGIAEPVRVREVMKQCARQSRFAAAQSVAVMPLVGRQDEMAVLKDRSKRAENGQGQIVLLTGEAGIGKSRLTRALIEDICKSDIVASIELQCSPYHDQSALFPVIEWLQAEIFASGDAVEDAEKWSLIHRFLDRTTLDKAKAAPLLAILLFVPLPADHAPLNLTQERLKRLTMKCIVSLFTQLNPSQYVLLVVEDLHWADPSTLELIGIWAAKTADNKTLTLLTCRPEFAPPWPAQANFTTAPIGRLSDQCALELVRLAAGDGILSERVMQQLVSKTDNVPLYLEELAKDLVLTRQMNAKNGVTQDLDGPADDLIPASLQDALMARLDRMGETKTVAQVAAILGRDFDRKTLEAVWTGSPSALHDGLDALLKADLLHARGERITNQYQFKHALIRDAAYNSLLNRSRENHHRHIAEVLAREFPDIATRQPDVLAQHYAAGKESDQAVNYWLAAGQLALKNYAGLEAVAHLNHGLALLPELPDTPERKLRELDLRNTLGPALMMTQGYAADDVRVSCTRAQELCALIGSAPQIPITLFQLWTYHVVSAQHATSLELAAQFLQIAEQTQNDDLLVEGYLILGIAYFFLGELHKATFNLEKCIESYDRERHGSHATLFGQDPEIISLSYLSWIYWLLGEPNKALQTSEQSVSLARNLNHPFTLSFALSLAGWHRAFCRDYPSADAISKETVQLCTDQNIMVFHAHGSVLTAWNKCGVGDTDNGLPEMQTALDFFRMTGSRCFLPYWDAFHAMSYAAAGDSMKAETILVQALEAMNQTGEHWCEAELHRYRAQLLEKQGAAPVAVEACYRKAIEVAQQQNARAWELRATLSLAHCLKAQGETLKARLLVESLQGRIPLDLDRESLVEAESLLASCA